MNYLVGDIQGCCDALDRLLAKIGFSPSRDRLYVLGDLVNRGPKSLETLRRLRSFGDAATCLLGNHDLNLFGVAAGVRREHKGDTIGEILASPEREEWIAWLRHRRLAVFEQGWLMVHAGVLPSWDLVQTLALAREVEAMLQDDQAFAAFVPRMYGDTPDRWRDDLEGVDRARLILNALTRARYVSAEGALDLVTKDAAGNAPPGFLPWFEVPGRRTEAAPIAFGHWAALGLLDRPTVLALDSGCVWGRQLSAARIDGPAREIISVECDDAAA